MKTALLLPVLLSIMLHATNISQYESECNNGNGEACYKVATLYQEGKGVKRDGLQATLFFKKACINKYTTACSDLAQSYVLGNYVEQNDTKAINYFNKDCNNKYDRGCHYLHVLYPEEYNMQMLKLEFRRCIMFEFKAVNIYDSLEDKHLTNINELEKIEEYYEAILGISENCPYDSGRPEAKTLAKKLKIVIDSLKEIKK